MMVEPQLVASAGLQPGLAYLLMLALLLGLQRRGNREGILNYSQLDRSSVLAKSQRVDCGVPTTQGRKRVLRFVESP
jgi:hypothetical protein